MESDSRANARLRHKVVEPVKKQSKGMNTGLTFLQLSTLLCPLWGHLLHVLDSCPWSVLMLCDITNDWERLVQMVFLKVQTLSLDYLLATRCWRGKAAVLMILTRPEIGLFILGCLPRNRLLLLKPWLDVFLLLFSDTSIQLEWHQNLAFSFCSLKGFKTESSCSVADLLAVQKLLK